MTTPQYSMNMGIVSSLGILAGCTFQLSAYTLRYFVIYGIAGFTGHGQVGIEKSGITAAGAKPGLINWAE
jgi:hypothetical protein